MYRPRTRLAAPGGWLLATALLFCNPPLADAGPATPAEASASSDFGALSLVVMDPLAAPLSCPCVEGYAQRDYEKLGEHLSERLSRRVTVTFAESLAAALKKPSCDHADIVIGKDSVVRADAAALGRRVSAVARLTGKDGAVTQTGLIVVRAGDPARAARDLSGYRVLFGPPECDEKFAAPRRLLSELGVEVPSPSESETSAACSDGACKILEWGDSTRAAAVISSYAAPLLEGCGTIQKGDLRVVAETEPVPFVTAFVTDRLTAAEQRRAADALLAIAETPEMLIALESMLGFVPLDDEYQRRWGKGRESDKPGGADKAPPEASAPGPSVDAAANDRSWPGFGGPTRNGRAAWLPDALPAPIKVVWSAPLFRPGLGGVAATADEVIIGDRDLSNHLDEWRCYGAEDGAERWTLPYPALGDLDYDNCPRATPLIDGGRAFLLGAFGDLHCVDVRSGEILWQTNLRLTYAATHELVWGCCSSPILVDGKLIVNPGASDAAWVALDPESGAELWRSPGDRHAYASPIVATLGGVEQLVVYDRTTLAGLDPATGRRLWTLEPPSPGDFNVPTPVVVNGRLLVTTENNGARLYAFDDSGRIVEAPEAVQRRLAPDMSTPVVSCGRVYCVWKRLFCLDAESLEVVWVARDPAFAAFGSAIAAGGRLLVTGRGGEVLLVDTTAEEYSLVSRLPLPETGPAASASLYSQPALVGTRLYLRSDGALYCLDLDAAS